MTDRNFTRNVLIGVALAVVLLAVVIILAGYLWLGSKVSAGPAEHVPNVSVSMADTYPRLFSDDEGEYIVRVSIDYVVCDPAIKRYTLCLILTNCDGDEFFYQVFVGTIGVPASRTWFDTRDAYVSAFVPFNAGAGFYVLTVETTWWGDDGQYIGQKVNGSWPIDIPTDP